MRRTFRSGFLGGIALAAAMLLTTEANAVTVRWNTCVDSGGNGTCDPGSLQPSVTGSSGTGVNQVLSFQAIGDPTRALTAEAFSTTNAIAPYGVAIKLQIGIFEGGLGTGTEAPPQHAVDNIGPDEFIVFNLGQDGYIPKSFRIGYLSGDSDITTYIGGTGGPNDILSKILAGTFNWDTFIANPGAQGFTSQTFLDVPVGVDQLFTNGASGHYLIIGARNETDTCAGVPCEGGDDAFKIQQVVADTPNVPEASTLLLLMTGLAGLTPFARRRR